MSDEDPVIAVIARKAYVPLRSDDDEVQPDNLGALKLGLMSLQFEDKNDPERAALYFGPNFPERSGRMAGAMDLLDKEREESEQAEVPTFNVDPYYAGGSVPQIH